MKQKRYLALLLALCLVLSLCACGKDTETNEDKVTLGPPVPDLTGVWLCIREDYCGPDGAVLASATIKDMTQMEEFAPTLTLNADGTGLLGGDGEEAAVTWEQTDVGLLLRGDAEALGAAEIAVTHSAADATLSLDYDEGEEGLVRMVFAKEGDPAIEASRAVSTFDPAALLDALYPEPEALTLLTGEAVEFAFTADDYDLPAVFTADAAGFYTFSTQGGARPTLNCYRNEEHTDLINGDYAWEEGEEALVTVPLEADETIYLMLSPYNYGDECTITVRTEYQQQEPLPEGVEALTPDEPTHVVFDSVFNAWFAFTAPEAGTYSFYSTGEADTMASAYNSRTDLTAIATDDDSGEGENFCLTLELEADQRIFLAASNLSFSGPGEADLTVTAGVPVFPEPDPAPEEMPDPALLEEPADPADPEAPADPEDALAAPALLPDDLWNGGWYGWWMCYDCTGTWADSGMEGSWWDCCGEIKRLADNAAVLYVWDEDGSVYDPMIQVTLDLYADETGAYAYAVSREGLFRESKDSSCPIGQGDWTLKPSAYIFEDMLVIDGSFVGEDAIFSYSVYLRPWGRDWADVEAECPEELPYFYYDWYLPLIQAGAPMPDSISAD